MSLPKEDGRHTRLLMLLRQFRGATEPAAVLIGWIRHEFPFTNDRGTQHSSGFSASSAAERLAARRFSRGTAGAGNRSHLRPGNAQWFRQSRRPGLRDAQSARFGGIDVGRCPLGPRLELPFFELASAHVDFAHARCATLRKKSFGTSLHKRALAYLGCSPSVSPD